VRLPIPAADQSAGGPKPTINHIFASSDGQEYVLVLVVSHRWHEPTTIAGLQDRIELAYEYIVSGELARAHPDSASAKKRIAIEYIHNADKAAKAFFQEAAALLAEQGIAFQAELLN
jgi:hypothetical protein